MKLRDYQEKAITDINNWFNQNKKGNPCCVMPTGSGKSHVIAAYCKKAIQEWPDTRILMLTHVKELIEQNSEKMKQHWPGAPLGVYSAGMKLKQLGEPITFASIQSIINVVDQVGHIDLIIIDECHLVSHKDQGVYRNLISLLSSINPLLRVVGFTATPYRLNHGFIDRGDSPIFDDLIQPVSILELIELGYLAPLRSKLTEKKLDVSDVKKRGGEYIESQMQAAVNTEMNNYSVVGETIEKAEGRKAWLFFCAGIDHAIEVKKILIDHGVTTECVTGKTPKKERENILSEFKAGKIKALTNANVLTTGFDYPDIDLIVMLRPTMSPSLYVQMAGRGMRPKSHTDHCMVLDFAGNINRHGPITALSIENKDPKKSMSGDAPVKDCPECHSIVSLSTRICPDCGFSFPIEKEKIEKRSNKDIMGISKNEMNVTEWQWHPHTSMSSAKEMIKVTYYGMLHEKPISEYLCITHEGYAGDKAIRLLSTIATLAGITENILKSKSIEEIVDKMNALPPPKKIGFSRDGKYNSVTTRTWEEENEEVA